MADTKVSALASATPVGTDLLYLVDDPGGTPISKKATAQSVANLYVETDPVVGAVTGIVKADGAGNISAATAGTDYLVNIVSDTTPQLGGNLDVNGHDIVSASNGNINIFPNGTGNVFIGNYQFDGDQVLSAAVDNYVLTYDNALGLVSLEAPTGGSALLNVVDDTSPQLGGDLDVNGNSIVSGTDVDIAITPGGVGNVKLGVFEFDADQTLSVAVDNYVLTYDNTLGTIQLEAPTGGGSGIAWSDAVDADIVPDSDGTRDLGTTTNRFAELHVDTIDLNGVTLDGTALADPGADRIVFWDDSAGQAAYLEAGPGLNLSGTTLVADEVIVIAVSDETTDLTTGTGKVTFRMPFAMTLTDVRASVTTAPTGAALIVDINDGGTTIMATNKLSIDANEKTSTTAATAAGITDTALADDAEITIDIDQIGSTIAGAGLKVSLIGVRA